ncbi:hypothetical protein [Kamptonema sp. UHCC 0994]|uniref:hypothetical protein n=1 Tax=Kamptonema sp. UHCC 0994 TaxID=3031329 RepID=UPI0023B93B03|nr:hypothetical protein [Kamptonema sp. UHCC 0994]MDF0552827.1 hypothetical protein [Kamptonema sp. UHCC 0994]
MDKEPRILIFAGEQNGCDVYVDLTEQIRSLVRWEIARAIAHLAPSPVEPLPSDELDDDITPRSLRLP